MPDSDNKGVKVFLKSILFFSLFIVSCVHEQVRAPLPKTMTSDLYPDKISRTEYYREIATAFARDGQTTQAIENYRLSLLHDSKNILAKLQLSDQFRKAKIDHLAITELAEVLQIQPGNVLALQKLGDLYLTTRIYSKARLAYEELQRLNPSDRRSIWALYYIDKIDKKYDSALAHLNRIETYVVQLSDEGQGYWNNSEAWFRVASEKAAIFRLQKNYSEEQKFLLSAYQVKPNFLAEVKMLSDSYFRTKNWKEAAGILQRYTEINDFNCEISERLAQASLELKNYEIVLREYAKQRPWAYDPYLIDVKTAHIYFLMKDYPVAEKKYLDLLARRANDEVKYYLSKIYQLTDRLSKSVAILEQFPLDSDYYGEAQVELADFEKKNDHFDLAINRLRKAHNRRPDQRLVYKAYADLLIENNRFVESIALLEEAILLYPKDEELRLKIAFAHYRMNNQKSFKKQISQAIAINPLNSKIYAGLAELWYIKNKKPADVETFIQKANQLKSGNQNLKPLLAWSMLEQNRSAEAIAVFEEYYEQNPNEYFYVKSLADIYQAGHVTAKANFFLKVAQGMESEANLKQKLLEKIQSHPEVLEVNDPSQARMPASLEN